MFWLEMALKKRDEERKKLRAAALAEGRAEGLEQGRAAGLEQGLEQGREQGRTEAYAAFAAWDARRRAAEAQGQAFTEPPPYRNAAGA